MFCKKGGGESKGGKTPHKMRKDRPFLHGSKTTDWKWIKVKSTSCFVSMTLNTTGFTFSKNILNWLVILASWRHRHVNKENNTWASGEGRRPCGATVSDLRRPRHRAGAPSPGGIDLFYDFLQKIDMFQSTQHVWNLGIWLPGLCYPPFNKQTCELKQLMQTLFPSCKDWENNFYSTHS